MLDTGMLAPSGSRARDEDDPVLARAAQLRAAPHFPEAVRAYAAAMTRFRLNGSARLNKLLGQDVRFRTVCFALYLHHEDGESRPDAGASYSRISELIGGSMGGGRRVVATTLDLMVAMGLARIERGATDHRLKLYRPTDQMFQLLRAWLESSFLPLDLIEPEQRRMERLREGDEILRQFILGAGRGFRQGEVLTWRMPQFSCFFDREGGTAYLASAVHEALSGRSLPSRAENGARFGISKSQISLIANEAARLGFLKTREGRDSATPLLIREYERWVSIILAFFAAATDA